MSPIKPRSSSRLTRQSENALAGPSSSSTRTTRARPSQGVNYASPNSTISSDLTDSEYEGDEAMEADSPVEAGPSGRPTRSSAHGQGQTTTKDVKGKGKAPALGQEGGPPIASTEAASRAGAGAGTNEAGPSRRVLPARIRRSAGGGEGMREVEEMIVDWLERWGEPTATPPDDLPFHLTSIPLSFVQPPPKHISSAQPEPPPITLTPTRKKADTQEEAKLGKEEKIEVPSWVMVRAGEDDEEEAREELEMTGRGRQRGVAGIVSPVKRLRRGGIGDEPDEDTSDAYYMQLHKKYEVFERRQRIREKETLQFERYKMRSRIDLLRNMPKLTWSSVVSTILTRGSDDWARGKEKIKEKGTDWLKSQLIKEGEEVMKRFDELLPPEQRKPKIQTSTQADSRQSTPSRASPSPSLTPPPIVLPARVAALRDPSTSSVKRKRRSVGAQLDETDYQAAADSPSKKSDQKAVSSSPRVVKTYGKRLRSDVSVELDDDGEVVGVIKEKTKMVTLTKTTHQTKPVLQPAPVATGQSPVPTDGNTDAIAPTTKKIDRPLYPIFNRPIRPAPAPTPTPTPAMPVTFHRSLDTVVTSAGTHVVLRNPASLPETPSVHSSTHTKPVASRRSQAEILVKPAAEQTQRVPYLIQAASRRERSPDNLTTSQPLDEPPKNGKIALPSKGKAATTRRPETMSNPFGLPVPSVLESKSEFTLAEKADFWPIIAQREKLANRQQKAKVSVNGKGQIPPSHPLGSVAEASKKYSAAIDRSALGSAIPQVGADDNVDGFQAGRAQKDEALKPSNGNLGTISNGTRSAPDSLTAEEVAEIEGVEAAVVL
ncbi:hypothetical protein IAU59_003023 [Kwoniella sp. CBS 9459]